MALKNLSRSIEGCVAVITGAGSGMGGATAKLFAEEGATVALIDLNEPGVLEVEKEIIDAGKSGSAWIADLGSKREIDETISAIAEKFNRIDLLINNAGISIPVAIDDEAYDEAWSNSVNVLLTAHTRTIRASLPWLRKSKNPRIVNIASTEGFGATKLGSPYTAAKHGVIGLTRSLAVELGPEGITVNCICPGPIRTGMTAKIPEEQKEIYARRRIALRRYADPEEVAHGTLNFCLPSSSFMTGAALPVDGGLTIKNA